MGIILKAKRMASSNAKIYSKHLPIEIVFDRAPQAQDQSHLIGSQFSSHPISRTHQSFLNLFTSLRVIVEAFNAFSNQLVRLVES